MSDHDIFVSYSHKDEARVRHLVQHLETHNWRVFWDRTIPPGETWRSAIGVPLDRAAVVIVVWSHHSVESDFVESEATRAKGRNVLVPVMIDAVAPPLGLDSIQAADLVSWSRAPGPLPEVLVTALDRRIKRAAEARRAEEETARSRAEADAHKRAEEVARERAQAENQAAASKLRAEELALQRAIEERAAAEERRRAEDAALRRTEAERLARHGAEERGHVPPARAAPDVDVAARQTQPPAGQHSPTGQDEASELKDRTAAHDGRPTAMPKPRDAAGTKHGEPVQVGSEGAARVASRRRLWPLAAGLLVLVAIGLAFLWSGSLEKPVAPPVASLQPAPAAAPRPQPAPPPAPAAIPAPPPAAAPSPPGAAPPSGTVASSPAAPPVASAPTPAPPSPAEVLVRDGVALQQAGQHREAIRKFQAALALSETGTIHFELGRSFQAIDDYAAALASFERAATLAGSDAERQQAVRRIEMVQRLMVPPPAPAALPPTALQAIAQGRWVIERIGLCTSDPTAIFRLELQGNRVIWRKGPDGSHGVFVEEVLSDTPTEARTISIAAPDMLRATRQEVGTRWRYVPQPDRTVKVEPSNQAAFTIQPCGG